MTFEDFADDAPVGSVATDDIQEMEGRVANLQKYVPYAKKAFAERGLTYPFKTTANMATLESLPGQRSFAIECAQLSSAVGIGGSVAKKFEVRAFRALHRLIGGWAVCVGAPREKGTGCRRAVRAFRDQLNKVELGRYCNTDPPRSGDYRMDGIWLLGREWGGPLVYFQAKNSLFDPDRFAGDLLRLSDSLNEWFGRPLDKYREVIQVCAVNTILTTELKEDAFHACKAGCGYHILDGVDILFAETCPDGFHEVRDRLQVL